MTSAAKRKGSGFEREIVKYLLEQGILAKRVPLSGAMKNYKGDVIVYTGTRRFQVECKRRRAGFKTLYEWLGDNDFLAFRDDKCEPLIAMSLKTFADLIGGEK